MSSTFMGIETSKRALFTQQSALQTTGQNISNANTAGFSRQVVNMSAAKPMEAIGMMRSTATGQIGTGVEASSITRIREQFLDDQFRNENKASGDFNIQADTLDKLQSIMNEPTDTGIRTVMDNFWKSWSDLSKDPENVTSRKIVRENANALADAFNYTSKQLKDLSSDLTNNINVKSSEINTKISTIATLNDQITRIEGLGDNANDLRDQRDLLTDDLSKIVNIQVQNTPSGYTINMGSVNLVTAGVGSTATTSDSLIAAKASGDLNSGEVNGMILSRDTFVADYQNQLDTLANTLANGDITVTIPKGSVLPEGTVLNDGTSDITYSGASRTLTADITVTVKGLNGLHKLGYIAGNPVTAAGDFFTAKAGFTAITAESFQLNPDISDNPNLIATSLRTTGTGTSEQLVNGNNTLALLVAQLNDTKFNFNNSTTTGIISKGTINDYFSSIVGQLGVQTEAAITKQQNQQAMVDQVDSRRQSISGVSLDEEMANMLKFQKAYTAAARIMTTFDECLDKVINSMGLVGR
ncbi:MAG: flagellar hook protein FlgK [Bacilli bacterium]|nr:flagellar hook protein FlgK [Bacilli bacterium]